MGLARPTTLFGELAMTEKLTKEELEMLLADLPAQRLTQEQIDQAWNYAYAYFHEFTRPFPWHLEKIMADLDKRSISYVLSPEGRREYEATFQELAGAPIKW